MPPHYRTRLNRLVNKNGHSNNMDTRILGFISGHPSINTVQRQVFCEDLPSQFIYDGVHCYILSSELVIIQEETTSQPAGTLPFRGEFRAIEASPSPVTVLVIRIKKIPRQTGAGFKIPSLATGQGGSNIASGGC